MAVKSRLVIDQGSDYEVTINVKDANSSPIDLTGYTGQAQMRKHFSSSTKYDFDVTITAQTGEVTLSMAAANTANIAHGRYVYDCFITSNNNVVSRVVEGIVTINPQVTK